MKHDDDERWMRRAIELAMRGRGRVEPNPMVGCVIVKNGRIIGEGWHRHFGGPHAEPEALAACREDPAGATAYVTLEPCCHVEKKTPPCVPRLIEAKLARVVIGCVDPNPQVCGQGIEQLRKAGIDVHAAVLEPETKQLNAPFFARTLHRRPYVTLKWAQSADGKVAGPGGRRVQISNPTSMRAIHEMRGRCDAILVGINTVLADDPLLTARVGPPLPPGGEGRGEREAPQPGKPLLRCILDRRLRIPLHSRLVQTAGEAPLIVYTSEEAMTAEKQKRAELESLGVAIVPAPTIADALADLHARSVSHLLIEPGPTLAAALFAANLPDRLWVIHSPMRIDDPTAPAAAPVPAHYLEAARHDLTGDVLIESLNPQSPVFFTAAASADAALVPRRSQP